MSTLELRKLLEFAERALEPFSHPDLSEQLSGNTKGSESIVYERNKATLTLGDFRKAANVCKSIQEVLGYSAFGR